jgi:hypothetical protein
MDSIAEVKVLTSNFQAEYGRNGGGVITVITRGGGTDFHVSAYDTYRHESLNANSFWNNRTKVAKAPYRYRITGYTVGGPVFIPKKFNTRRDKLFFFWNQEYTGQRKDYGTRLQTMPTAAERAGDFSKSVTSSGSPIVIKDPLNGVQFPGNIVPTARLSPIVQKLRQYYPTPTLSRITGNFPTSLANNNTTDQTLDRVDQNAGDKSAEQRFKEITVASPERKSCSSSSSDTRGTPLGRISHAAVMRRKYGLASPDIRPIVINRIPIAIQSHHCEKTWRVIPRPTPPTVRIARPMYMGRVVVPLNVINSAIR